MWGMRFFLKSLFIVFFVNFLLILLFEKYLEIERSTSLLMLLQIAIMTVYMTFISKEGMESFGIRLPNKNSWLMGVLLTFLGAIFVNFLVGYGGITDRHPVFSDFSPIEAVFIFIICAPISEELLFRGWVMQITDPLKSRGIHLGGVFLSLPNCIATLWFVLDQLQLFFMEMGWQFVLAALCSAVFMGLITGYYREKTDSLFVAIVLHSLFNAIGCVFYYNIF